MQQDESTVDTLIVGAGLSGLMMGYLLHNRSHLIIESAKTLNFDIGTPFYLHAPLDWLPTSWKEIDVHHHCWDGERFYRIPSLKMMNDYSRKIVGKIVDTSLKFMDGEIKRGFIPELGGAGQVLRDLFEETKNDLLLGASLNHLDSETKTAYILAPSGAIRIVHYKNLISTIPLPALLKMLKIEFNHKFVADPITTFFIAVPPSEALDSFQVVNITSKHNQFYRASLMGNTIIMETMVDDDDNIQEIVARETAEDIWGVKLLNQQITKSIVRPGKFHPVDLTARKQLLARLSGEFGIYCLGRYATWSYKRIDHIAQDAQTILKLMKMEQSQ